MKYCIVKRPLSLDALTPVILSSALTVALALLFSFKFTFIPFLVALCGAVLVVYLIRITLNAEYEYTIEGDTFSIALIKNKASRKELLTGSISHLASCTPYEDRDTYLTPNKTINATAKENYLYYIVFTQEENTVAAIFSPSEEFVKELRVLAPSKVKTNILH